MFSQDADGVTVDILGREERYNTVIGAGGIQSAARQATGLDFSGYDLQEDWDIADVESEDWPHPDRFQVFFLLHGDVVVVVPLEANRFRVIGSEPDVMVLFSLNP